MLMQRRKKAARTATVHNAPRKLHTITGLLRGRLFAGQFEAPDGAYQFIYAPTTASLSSKLELVGRFSVHSVRGGTRAQDGVRATLISTQGGVGASPVRRQLAKGTEQTSQIATPEQKLEQEKAPETALQPSGPGPETTLQPGLQSFEPPKRDAQGRPVVESTGPLAFVGVMYFRLQPLDGSALGVPLDLTGVQLNARLAPADDLARDLRLLFSDLVAAAYGDHSDAVAASGYLKEINSILRG